MNLGFLNLLKRRKERNANSNLFSLLNATLLFPKLLWRANHRAPLFASFKRWACSPYPTLAVAANPASAASCRIMLRTFAMCTTNSDGPAHRQCHTTAYGTCQTLKPLTVLNSEQIDTCRLLSQNVGSGMLISLLDVFITVVVFLRRKYCDAVVLTRLKEN